MRQPITSTKNPRVNAARKLRAGRERRKQNRFLIDGRREIEKAIRSGIEIEEIFFAREDEDNHADQPADYQSESFQRIIDQTTAEEFELPKAIFEKVAYGERVLEPVAVAKTPNWELNFQVPEQGGLYVILEQIEKPGNVGAVFRTAAGANVDGVILSNALTDLFNPNAIRASLGTIFSVNCCRASNSQTLDWLRKNQIQIVATRVDGSVPHTTIDYRPNTAIVLGSEANGLSADWNAEDILATQVPMSEKVDSLNISATAAILMYEARRPRD